MLYGIALRTGGVVAMAPRFIVEYAKSGRSGCKECGGKIAERSVRLGSITRIKGYDTCNWYRNQSPHYLDFFSFKSMSGIACLNRSNMIECYPMISLNMGLGSGIIPSATCPLKLMQGQWKKISCKVLPPSK